MTLVLEEADLTLHSIKCAKCGITADRIRDKLSSKYYFCSKACFNVARNSLVTIVTDGDAV